MRSLWPDASFYFFVPSYVASILHSYGKSVTTLSYEKRKHHDSLGVKCYVTALKFTQLWKLRSKRVDIFFFLGDGSSDYARQLRAVVKPKKFVSFSSHPSAEQLDLGSDTILVCSPARGNVPEFIRLQDILTPFGAPASMPKVPLLSIARHGQDDVRGLHNLQVGCSLGIHLSARRLRQRWPMEYFALLLEALKAKYAPLQVLVTWSPGNSEDLKHPGDDEMAEQLRLRVDGLDSVHFLRTGTLAELLSIQSLCKVILCSDGGAMHTAAALGVKVVAMYGDSDPIRWAPVGVGHRIIVGDDKNVGNISVERVLTEIQLALADDRP